MEQNQEIVYINEKVWSQLAAPWTKRECLLTLVCVTMPQFQVGAPPPLRFWVTRSLLWILCTMKLAPTLAVYIRLTRGQAVYSKDLNKCMELIFTFEASWRRLYVGNMRNRYSQGVEEELLLLEKYFEDMDELERRNVIQVEELDEGNDYLYRLNFDHSTWRLTALERVSLNAFLGEFDKYYEGECMGICCRYKRI